MLHFQVARFVATLAHTGELLAPRSAAERCMGQLLLLLLLLLRRRRRSS